jgi:hypothetical protein
VTLGLEAFKLTALNLDISSGDLTATLPASDGTYAVDVNTSSGDATITLVDGAAVNFSRISLSSGDLVLNSGATSTATGSIRSSSGAITLNFGADSAGNYTIDGSSGNVVIDITDGAAIRLEVLSLSSGDVIVLSDMQRVSGSGEEKTGVWQSAGYDSADRQIKIVVTRLSSGNVEVR